LYPLVPRYPTSRVRMTTIPDGKCRTGACSD
jgi:hypothetical protein